MLHLSDIHFRREVAGRPMDPHLHLRNEILRDVEVMKATLGNVDAILISGDVAFSGHPEEYRFAQQWIARLCDICGCAATDVFVCPGNHDVARNITSSYIVKSLHKQIRDTLDHNLETVLRGMLYDPEAGKMLYESLSAYNNFALQYFCDILPPDRTVARRELTLNDGSSLHLVAFNSAFVSGADDVQGQLLVDPACYQLERVRGTEYLVMCHHPLNWLRRGNELGDRLNDVAKIQLFGHEHRERVQVFRDYVRVAAAAMHPDRSEGEWEPGYNWIEATVITDGSVRELEVTVHVRVWQESPAQFRPMLDRGSVPFFRQKIHLDDWVPPAAESAQSVLTAASQDDATTPLDSHRSDLMGGLREISLKFFQLTLSQKSAIVGKLNLFEDEDVNLPDFARFRLAFARARERGQLEELDREIRAISTTNR